MKWKESKSYIILSLDVLMYRFQTLFFEWWKGEGNFPHDGNLKFSCSFFFAASVALSSICAKHMEGWREGGNVYWVWNSHYAIFPHTYRHVILYIYVLLFTLFSFLFSNLFTHKMKFFSVEHKRFWRIIENSNFYDKLHFISTKLWTCRILWWFIFSKDSDVELIQFGELSTIENHV